MRKFLDVRLLGTQEECETGVAQISKYFNILQETRFYPNRRGSEGRLYLVIELKESGGEAQ